MILTATPGKTLPPGLLDLLIRAVLIAILAFACYRVFRPFIDLLVWALILSITLFPLQRKLEPRLRGKSGLTATVIILFAIAVLIVPVYLLGMSLASWVGDALDVVRAGNFHIPPPPQSVADWPLLGAPLHAAWSQAATDLTGVSRKLAPQIAPFALVALGKVAGAGMGVLMFFAALAVSGVFMAFAHTGHRHALLIAARIVGPGKAAAITDLCTSTVRAVAQGVVGIAFVQMLMIGIAFVLMDVPGAALLSLAVLLLGIMQIPATLITLPVIIFVFATHGAGPLTIAFATYVFIAGLIDNVLKPLLLGRGVRVPMPVVLIGALGGMVSNGIIGLFTGPVVLAVGYVLFWQWIEQWPVEDQARHTTHDGSA
ncbi:putative PurR-regulated permease PerM [Pseudoxanthomonas sp. 3HH-4]|uniref:AI-2E family transporter n=1 Tax=Pseudoxanthomonas sp. 3HH-4 TaxID=1690214 RepID=UPI0011522FCE|nr:AI-2E family transporter [Pseudoxanthomonas sp. 3HH-4]TQM12099.1 putative PurR-regulated permease PerM [Pseudoxanthomonas sp. 3HH-4]